MIRIRAVRRAMAWRRDVRPAFGGNALAARCLTIAWGNRGVALGLANGAVGSRLVCRLKWSPEPVGTALTPGARGARPHALLAQARCLNAWRARVDLVSSEALSTLLLGARGPVIEGAGETETVREPGVSVRHFAFPLACFRSGCRALVGAPWRRDTRAEFL